MFLAQLTIEQTKRRDAEHELELVSQALQGSKHECIALQDKLEHMQIMLAAAEQSSATGLSIKELEGELSRYKRLYEEALYLKLKYEEQLNEYKQAQLLLENSDVFNTVIGTP